MSSGVIPNVDSVLSTGHLQQKHAVLIMLSSIQRLQYDFITTTDVLFIHSFIYLLFINSSGFGLIYDDDDVQWFNVHLKAD